MREPDDNLERAVYKSIQENAVTYEEHAEMNWICGLLLDGDENLLDCVVQTVMHNVDIYTVIESAALTAARRMYEPTDKE